MSMLAEPKKKSKLTLNPRGALWSKDENKIGQKLLEKMGWSRGKGLGRNEQGIKEPIRVSANPETKGVGFKGNAELSTQHYQDFEDVLSSLNSVNNSEGSSSETEKDSLNLKNVESLEMKSKSSRSRVHYSKFTRGKDLSRYNEDDLACVLGSKMSSKRKRDSENVSKDIKEAEEGVKENEKEETNEKDFTYGGNLKEYFNQKMDELKRKRAEGLLGDEQTPPHNSKKCNSQPGTPFPDLEFEPAKTDFSFNLSVQGNDLGEDCDQKMESDNVKDETIDSKKKKHKKSKKRKDAEKAKNNDECLEGVNEVDNDIKKENIENEMDEQKQKMLESECMNDNIDGNDSSEIKPKKKKKKKSIKEKEEGSICNDHSEEPQRESNSELNVQEETRWNSCHMNESYVKATSTEEKKKAKKRKGSNEDISEDKENSNLSRPLKKLRKLASEIHLPEVLKSSLEKVENENNSNSEIENGINDQNTGKEEEEEEMPKTKVKLKSKRSFKELKSELGAKVREKIKKKSKTELVAIDEEQEETSEKNVKESLTNKDTILNLDVPLSYKETDILHSAPKQCRTVTFDVEKTFPGSNLHKIKGYYKNK